jgi:hypothetical protein
MARALLAIGVAAAALLAVAWGRREATVGGRRPRWLVAAAAVGGAVALLLPHAETFAMRPPRAADELRSWSIGVPMVHGQVALARGTWLAWSEPLGWAAALADVAAGCAVPHAIAGAIARRRRAGAAPLA